jgi:hypothetical protein
MHVKAVHKKLKYKVTFTFSKAIGRDNFSMGADEEADDECDGMETVEAAELMDERDDVGRSEYNTSWLFDGKETATAAIVNGDDAAGDGSIIRELSRMALSGGSLLLGGGSMAQCLAQVMCLFWHQFFKPFSLKKILFLSGTDSAPVCSEKEAFFIFFWSYLSFGWWVVSTFFSSLLKDSICFCL